MENPKKNKLQKYIIPILEFIVIGDIDILDESDGNGFDKGEWDHI